MNIKEMSYQELSLLLYREAQNSQEIWAKDYLELQHRTMQAMSMEKIMEISKEVTKAEVLTVDNTPTAIH